MLIARCGCMPGGYLAGGAGYGEILALGAVRVGGADAVIDVEAFLHRPAQAGALQRFGKPDQDDAVGAARKIGRLHIERLLHFSRIRLATCRRSRCDGEPLPQEPV